jgi:hypothetical protein
VALPPTAVEVRLYPEPGLSASFFRWPEELPTQVDPVDRFQPEPSTDFQYVPSASPGAYSLVVRVTWEEDIDVFYALSFKLADAVSLSTPAPSVHMPDKASTSHASTPDGALWVAFDDFDDIGGAPPYAQRYGLYRSKDGQVSHFDIPGPIRVLEVAPDGSLYVGARCGVLRYRADRWETLAGVDCDRDTFTHGFVAFDMAFTQDGGVWVGGVHSLVRFDSVAATQYDVNVRRVWVAPDSSLWGEGWDGIAGSDCCFVHVTGHTWVTYTHSAVLPVSKEWLAEIHALKD